MGGFLAFEARDRGGQVLLRSYDAKEYAFPAVRKDGYLQDGNIHSFTVSDPVSGISLTVVEPAAHRAEAANEATLALFVPLALLIPLMIGAVSLITRHAAVPVRELRQQIGAQGGSRLEPIQTARQPVELRPIAGAVDRLTERLRTAANAERSFAANSAHELSLRLGDAMAHMGGLRKGLDGSPAMAHVARVEATLQGLSHFADRLLQLSRAGTTAPPGDVRGNLSPVLKRVVDALGRDGGGAASIVVEDRLKQDLMVAMDPDAFAICVANLLENALLHGGSDLPVQLNIEKDWSLHVINRGAVVSPDQLRGLVDRFASGDTPASGSGLGLAIVDRIMKQSGGSLTLHSPATGAEDGFEAVLHLP